MIYANLKHEKSYNMLDTSLMKCLDYIKNNDLINADNGRYDIDGDNIFLNIMEYETTTENERIWEAHKKYIDIHYVITGAEKISLNFTENLSVSEYKEEDDLIILTGKESNSAILENCNFLICFPDDAHMTALKINEPNHIKKAVFKIAVK